MTFNHTATTPSFPRRREFILGHCLRPSDLSRTNLSTVIPAENPLSRIRERARVRVYEAARRIRRYRKEFA